MTFLIAVVMVLGVIYRAMKPEERERVVDAVATTTRRFVEHRRRELAPYWEILKARRSRVIVMPTVVAVNAAVFITMLFSSGSLADPATLVSWGASLGPRTTNGEWWRLVTAIFVHDHALSLAIAMVAFVQAGLILERLVGRAAFAIAYLSSGCVAAVTALWITPITVTRGASGAVWGVYGLLLASIIGGWLHRSTFTIPLVVIKQCAPVALLFAAVSLTDGDLSAGADLAGFAAGFVYGLSVALDVSDSTPPSRRLAVAATTMVAIAAAAAAPLRGIADVKPELGRLVDLESGTNDAYNRALDKFKKHTITADTLAAVIERTIVPQFEAADPRIAALSGVAREDQGRVADAREYLRLRSDSWRLRARGLRLRDAQGSGSEKATTSVTFRSRAESRYRSSMIALGNAEGAERAALDALRRAQR